MLQQQEDMMLKDTSVGDKRKYDDGLGAETERTNEQAQKKYKQLSIAKNYKGLPMFRLMKKKIMKGDDDADAMLLRHSDMEITFATPTPYGQCYYFNAKVSKVGAVDTHPNIMIETLGSLETYGFVENDKFNTNQDIKKSNLTLRIPKDSQTFKTLKLFEEVVQDAFARDAKTWLKNGSNYQFESLMKKTEEFSGPNATLKLKVERSKREPNECLVDVTQIKKVTDSATGKVTHQVIEFPDGIEGVGSMYEVRVLMKWNGVKILNSTKKVYHNLSLKAVQVIRESVNDTFESKFDPNEPAP
mmetsp:Transcript_25491/g.35575  ORF Transcript_25491/g.35575 Transcript_25491/m.35575 type:complete len:301 (+) Transcript_25491:92-994(+)